MAIPSTLLPAARSAYRNVLRSARATFHNDPPRHAAMVVAVRETFASPTLTRPGAELPPPTLNEATGEPIVVDLSSPEELQKRINEWNEVATFLRRNVVQGRQDDQGVYSESWQCFHEPQVRDEERRWRGGRYPWYRCR